MTEMKSVNKEELFQFIKNYNEINPQNKLVGYIKAKFNPIRIEFIANKYAKNSRLVAYYDRDAYSGLESSFHILENNE